MFESELAALASRFDLSSEAVARLRELLVRASATDVDQQLTHTGDSDVGTLVPVTIDVAVVGDGPRSSLPTLVPDDEVTQEAGGLAGVTRRLGPGPRAPEPQQASRYDDLGLIGTGGMGEVRRVRDRALNRTMAMKVLKQEIAGRRITTARFVEEAQATAQLQHPGVVPVHELGRLPDGRPYFTMREVRGRTLGTLITEVHEAVADRSWRPTPDGWTFRRLVDVFLRVCEAVTYAHDRGVVHRDLKPENLMIGEHGEALVMDWGLSKIAGREELATEDLVITDRSRDDALATRMGQVSGTPAYMAPEQARGAIDRIGPWSDVYALGSILYEILAGTPPYRGDTAADVLSQVVAGAPRPLLSGEDGPEGAPRPAEEGPPLPRELVLACRKAMSREPEDRFPDARGLTEEIRAWLDGARKREQALEAVRAAQDLEPEIDGLRERAEALRQQADALLMRTAPWHPETAKIPGWSLEDQAVELERRADLLAVKQLQGLAGALQIDASLPEAHAALAEHHRAAHERAEADRDDAAARHASALMEHHAAALPADHRVRRACASWLRGDGALSLRVDPESAEVWIAKYELQNRRLVLGGARSLGAAPLRAHRLPMGSYVCELRHPDRATVRYPVHLGRGEHWDGVRPGTSATAFVRMPRRDELGPDDVYVPAGPFWSGGDPVVPDCLPRRKLWVDAFVIRRFPVTNREYLAYLDELVATGHEDLALKYAPRERGGTSEEAGAMIYGRDARGRFVLRPDADGDVWEADGPVCMVDWWGAVAYAAWLARKTGLAWRLPGELEWEKAARGVDGRFAPWGDHLDASWTCVRSSHAGRPMPAPVTGFPVDESPYGVRGMGGNMRDWTADVGRHDGPPVRGGVVDPPVISTDPAMYRVFRGGGYFQQLGHARSCYRFDDTPEHRMYELGFRLARPFPAVAPPGNVGPSLTRRQDSPPK